MPGKDNKGKPISRGVKLPLSATSLSPAQTNNRNLHTASGPPSPPPRQPRPPQARRAWRRKPQIQAVGAVLHLDRKPNLGWEEPASFLTSRRADESVRPPTRWQSVVHEHHRGA